MTDHTNTKNSDTLRWAMIVALVLIAFFGAYRFASARSGSPTGAATAAGPSGSTVPTQGGSGASAGCACCGTGGAPTAGGVTGKPTEGAAILDGGIQKISVDVSTVYNPNTIKLKAGVPAEITFGQAQGCTQVVQSADLGFSEDLSAGPKTVKLQGLQPGTYTFSCGMQMVFGKIVVE